MGFCFLAYIAITTWKTGRASSACNTGKTPYKRWVSAVRPQHFLSHRHGHDSKTTLLMMGTDIWAANISDEELRTSCLKLLVSYQLTGNLIWFPGNFNDNCIHLLMESTLSSPKGCRSQRFSSDSSYRSVMTDGSDHASVFGDLCSSSPCSAASTTDDSCFFSKDFPSQDASRRFLSSSGRHHQSLSLSSSSSLAGSSSSLSPSWDETKISSLFGTLPRKGRRVNVRKQIFKLIPGLQRSVEEEEIGTNTQWLVVHMLLVSIDSEG